VVVPKGASGADVAFTLLAAEAAIGVDGPARCAPDDAFAFVDPGGCVELGFLGVAVFLPATDPVAVADSEGAEVGALFELPRVEAALLMMGLGLVLSTVSLVIWLVRLELALAWDMVVEQEIAAE
jgi:hypothetical protein